MDERRSALLNVDMLPELAEELLQPTGKCNPTIDLLEKDSALQVKMDQRCGATCKEARNISTYQLAILEATLEEKLSKDRETAKENFRVK